MFSNVSERAAPIVFFPEGAFGPTNNCVGIGDVLRRRRRRKRRASSGRTSSATGFGIRLDTYGHEPAELTADLIERVSISAG
jgi:UDP:flavonoid glycosyltransferase YjiC (YdhE family)